MAKNYRPLVIPKGVEARTQAESVLIKGKQGSVSVPIPTGVVVAVEGSSIVVNGSSPATDRALIGTTRAHIRNALVDVTDGHEIVLEVRGMGYRVQKTKDGIQLNCGFSHNVDIPAPSGITFDVAQMPNPDDVKVQMFVITIKGVDRQAVGDLAARIRSIRPPDSYQGKGIRYRGERVRKKAGKRAAGAQA